MTYWPVAQKLLGRLVVVYLPDNPPDKRWKGGYLIGLLPAEDLFYVKWTRTGFGRTLKGIWRVHTRALFTGTKLLPVPKYPAKLPQSTNRSKEDQVATRKVAKKAATPTTKRRTKAAASADENGAKKSTGRTRGPDKLEGLTESQRRKVAALIFRERSKSPATSWPDIQEMVEDKFDWSLPGSMTGRRLLREYGPDEAEDAIIKQDRSASKSKAKAKPTKKSSTRKRAPVVEDDDEDEEELEDEELEDEEDEDIEAEEDEDFDEEDEEDEEEEEPVPPPKAKKVRVTRGRGRKANPS